MIGCGPLPAQGIPALPHRVLSISLADLLRTAQVWVTCAGVFMWLFLPAMLSVVATAWLGGSAGAGALMFNSGAPSSPWRELELQLADRATRTEARAAELAEIRAASFGTALARLEAEVMPRLNALEESVRALEASARALEQRLTASDVALRNASEASAAGLYGELAALEGELGAALARAGAAERLAIAAAVTGTARQRPGDAEWAVLARAYGATRAATSESAADDALHAAVQLAEGFAADALQAHEDGSAADITPAAALEAALGDAGDGARMSLDGYPSKLAAAVRVVRHGGGAASGAPPAIDGYFPQWAHGAPHTRAASIMPSTADVVALINGAIAAFAADTVAATDYALASAGGRNVPARSSPVWDGAPPDSDQRDLITFQEVRRAHALMQSPRLASPHSALWTLPLFASFHYAEGAAPLATTRLLLLSPDDSCAAEFVSGKVLAHVWQLRCHHYYPLTPSRRDCSNSRPRGSGRAPSHDARTARHGAARLPRIWCRAAK